MGKAKVWYETNCRKHGSKNKATGDHVVKGSPANHDRGIKYSGCPICKAEEED